MLVKKETLSNRDMKRVQSINQDFLFHVSQFFFQVEIIVAIVSQERSETNKNISNLMGNPINADTTNGIGINRYLDRYLKPVVV